MKNFLNENWFKVGLLIILLIAACSFGYDQIEYLPSKNKAVAEAETNASNVQNSMDCGRYTKNLFSDEMSSKSTQSLRPELPSYESHYNSTLQKCFGLISYTFPTINSKISFNSFELYDVYDNNLVDSCLKPLEGSSGGSSSCDFDAFKTEVNSDMQNTVNW